MVICYILTVTTGACRYLCTAPPPSYLSKLEKIKQTTELSVRNYGIWLGFWNGRDGVGRKSGRTLQCQEIKKNEVEHDRTTKLICAPSEKSDQSAHPAQSDQSFLCAHLVP